jgi:hypothetical protein
MDVPADSADAKVAELREAVGTIRALVPAFRGGPMSEYVPMAVARLVEAVADSMDRGDPVRDQVVSSALEIARHLRSHRPGESPG